MPPDDDSLQRIAALERKVAQLERQLAEARLTAQRADVQQALMDERLLALERNRLFRLWGTIYRTAAGLYGRLGIGSRYGGVSDLRTPGDYARWVIREQEQFSAEDHRAEVGSWRSQPLICVLIKGDTGAGESVRSLAEQCYPHWEYCLPPVLELEFLPPEVTRRMVENPTAEYRLVLHDGQVRQVQLIGHQPGAEALTHFARLDDRWFTLPEATVKKLEADPTAADDAPAAYPGYPGMPMGPGDR